LDDSLEVVVKLATDIFINVESEQTVDQFFKYKSNIFKEPLSQLTA